MYIYAYMYLCIRYIIYSMYVLYIINVYYIVYYIVSACSERMFFLSMI